MYTTTSIRIYFSLLIGLLPLLALSQSGSSPERDRDSIEIEISPYGSFRGHLAFFEGEAQIQENASRIGFETSVRKKGFRYFARVELAINLFRARQFFNADATTGSGFLLFDEANPIQVFTTRLGYLGVDMGPYGTITVGKDWGVHYDIAGYTDRFNVFGGTGSATYVAASDGGDTGTGRANQVFLYHNSLGRFHFGGQLQMRSVTNGYFFDGYGISGQFEVFDGFRVGSAYNRTYFSDFLRENTLGWGGQPEYLIFGASYVADTWDLGAVYSRQTNGDLTRAILDDEEVAIVFDATGYELLAKYKQPKFTVLLGFNGYFPNTDNLPVDRDARTERYILGAEFKPTPYAYFYAEYRYSQGINQFGIEAPNVFTLGIRIEASRTFRKFL